MQICTLTEAAASQISKVCDEERIYGIRLDVKGGGCAGFEYDWNIVPHADDLQNNDEVIATLNGHFVVGYHSRLILMGTQVDYKESIMGSSFEVTNPNAKSSCGCGVSFDVEPLVNVSF